MVTPAPPDLNNHTGYATIENLEPKTGLEQLLNCKNTVIKRIDLQSKTLFNSSTDFRMLPIRCDTDGRRSYKQKFRPSDKSAYSKVVFFFLILFLNQNVCRGYSKEPSQ